MSGETPFTGGDGFEAEFLADFDQLALLPAAGAAWGMDALLGRVFESKDPLA